MKIGILTIFNGNYNYGGMLQAYALTKVCNNLGNKSLQILFDGGKNVIYPSLFKQCCQYSLREVISKIIGRILEKKGNGLIAEKINQRKLLFDKFVKDNIPITRKFYSLKNKSDLGKDFDALIVGSDQVWNPNVVNSFYMLDIPSATKNLKKISYSASIGRGCLSKHESSVFKYYLDAFDAISVRESSAKQLLERADIKIPVQTVLDPTMLLSKEDWISISSDRIIKEKYVLLYSFSNCGFQKELKEYYTRIQGGYKVVFIPFVKQTFNRYDSKSSLTPLWNVGPSEFLSLIRYADYIITDSFHGAVFSIIFNRQFFVFNRDSNKAKTSKNARLTDLLSTYNLSNRMIGGIKDIKSKQSIDYSSINSIRAEYAKSSIGWLKTALE